MDNEGLLTLCDRTPASRKTLALRGFWCPVFRKRTPFVSWSRGLLAARFVTKSSRRGLGQDLSAVTRQEIQWIGDVEDQEQSRIVTTPDLDLLNCM